MMEQTAVVSVRAQVRLREAGHLEIAFRCPKKKKKEKLGLLCVLICA